MTGRQKRILILVENLPVPFDRRVWMEAMALRDAGYGVSVICPRGGKYKRLYEVIEGVTIYRYPLTAEAGHIIEYLIAWPATLLLAVIAKLHRGFDVIQSANPPDFFFAIALLFRPFGVRFVFDHHDLVPETCETRWSGVKLRILRRLTLLAERWTFRSADRVISTNESYREVAIRRGGVPPEHAVVVRSGPQSDRFKPVPAQVQRKNGRAYLVCYLGVMGPNDGLDLLLRSIAFLVHELKRDDIHFALIGAGDMLPSLQKLADELRIMDFVQFTGRIPDEEVIALLSTADVGVAPDPKDPLNDVSTMNKIIEYMAMGKPVVVFDLKEARVSAGEAAVYATPNDPADFARKITELLEDPERRFYMGAIGRERFREKLAWEHQRDNLLRMYAGLFGEPAKDDGLRILFLNHNVVRAGGTFFRALDAGRHLVRRGHHVTLLSIDPVSRFRISTEVIDGVEVVHTPDLFWGLGRSGWDPWDVLVRLRYVMRRDWDVVHAWDCRPAVIFPSLAVRFLKNGKNVPLFIDWCDWWGRGGTQMERGGSWLRYVYNAVETFFEESFRRYGDGSTVISRALFDRAVRLGVPAEKIRMLPQGCDEITAPDISRADARKELGIDTDAVLLISVGVLNLRDAALLFEAARLVRQKIPTVQFCLIGKNRARVPADLANTVIHDLGYLPNEALEHYLAAADAAVVSLADTLSSRSRWPSRLNMCMSRSLVIVTSRVGDLPLLLERENAAFVSSPDAHDLAEHIVLAVTDTEAAERVRTAAVRVATEMLDWPTIIEGLEKFYLHVASDRVSAAQTA